MVRSLVTAALVASVLYPVAADAAAVGKIVKSMGSVRVNGSAVTGGVSAGDLVQTDALSSAVIVFADGCRITVSPKSVIKIGAVSPCVAGAAGAGAAAGLGAGAAAGAATGVAAGAAGGAIAGSTLAIAGSFALLSAVSVAAIIVENPTSP